MAVTNERGKMNYQEKIVQKLTGLTDAEVIRLTAEMNDWYDVDWSEATTRELKDTAFEAYNSMKGKK